MKWRLYAGGLWYEPLVNIKQAKEMSEVFDQDRPLETVYRHDLLLQGPSTFSWNCVVEEGHFRLAKNTFGWIQQDTILAEALKQSTQMLLVLILRGRCD